MSKRPFLWLIVILFILTSCDPPPPPPPTPTPTIAALPSSIPESEQGLNFLVSTTESVQLKRRDWFDYQPVSFGATIRHGDLILPPPGEVVTILCADLTVYTIEQEEGSPCEVTNPDLFWDGVRIITPMAAPASFPYILYPRNTQILDAHPLLRWHDTGASSYTVAIIEGGEPIWEQTGVTATEIRYPDDAPPLVPEIIYLLRVRDEETDKDSSEDPIPGLGFHLLDAETATQITATEAEIHALALDPAAQQFAQAIYYAGQGLHGDALVLLNTIAQTQDAPAIQLWRGHLLLATRLYSEAEIAYNNALTLATTLGDVETQAQAHIGLWHATKTITHFDKACTLYQQLGDEQAIANLQNEQTNSVNCPKQP